MLTGSPYGEPVSVRVKDVSLLPYVRKRTTL